MHHADGLGIFNWGERKTTVPTDGGHNTILILERDVGLYRLKDGVFCIYLPQGIWRNDISKFIVGGVSWALSVVDPRGVERSSDRCKC